jgi:hypothetical protein
MRIDEVLLEKNIAEYIIYMYQTEDLIRSNDFNIDVLEANFLKGLALPEPDFIRQRNWYVDIAGQMRRQGLEKQGHLSLIQEIMVELAYLHTALLAQPKDLTYRLMFETTLPHIEEFQEHSNLKKLNIVEVCFHALYMKMLLKIQGKEITSATEESFAEITKMIVSLAKAYHKMKAGNSDFLNN